MKTLLKTVKVIDKNSPFHLQKVNILLENKEILQISHEDFEVDKNTEIVDCQGFNVSLGWLDMCVYSGEPGAEHKETLASLCEAAKTGGFTNIAINPNTNPIIQTKEIVKFIKNHSQENITLHPIAALSINLGGEEMTDFIDLHTAGAIAFSDGLHSITNTAMLTKSLLYLQHIDGLLINRPDDKYLSKYGLMHEGEVSTYLGLKGMPSIAEELGIVRDLKILSYTRGKIHFSNISSAESVQLVREAKEKGLAVTCDIAAHQLTFLDEDLQSFDTYLKVKPPFRTEKDRIALLEGLADGTIDCIVSAHLPCDEESKAVEFDLAEFGILGLQTAFSAARTATEKYLSVENIIEKFTTNPRKILKLAPANIAVGQKTHLTVFDAEAEFTLKQEDIVSLSRNTPYVGKKLKGKVIKTF